MLVTELLEHSGLRSTSASVSRVYNDHIVIRNRHFRTFTVSEPRNIFSHSCAWHTVKGQYSSASGSYFRQKQQYVDVWECDGVSQSLQTFMKLIISEMYSMRKCSCSSHWKVPHIQIWVRNSFQGSLFCLFSSSASVSQWRGRLIKDRRSRELVCATGISTSIFVPTAETKSNRDL